MKKLDGSMLPPCKKVLLMKFKRTEMIARRWASSPFSQPPQEDPEQFGWTKDDNKYSILWYEGDATPSLCELKCEDDNELVLSDDDIDGKFLFYHTCSSVYFFI